MMSVHHKVGIADLVEGHGGQVDAVDIRRVDSPADQIIEEAALDLLNELKDELSVNR